MDDKVWRAGVTHGTTSTTAIGGFVSSPGSTGLDVAEYIETRVGRWWVVHTRARHEKVVALSLAKRGVNYYLPLVRVQRTYAKARVAFRLPLFPGYLFVCGDHGACEAAWSTRRVANILRVDDQVRFRKELAQVYRAIESGESVDLFPALRKGRRCRVVGGPLRGVEGIVIRRGHSCRMYLAVTTLGQSAVVEIDSAFLEPID